MSGSNFYKYAFWLLVATVAAFQLVITIVAHSHHTSSQDVPVLPLKGRRPAQKMPELSRAPGQQHAAASGSTKKKVWEEVLSTTPRIVLLHNFATKDE
jgi:hypothetical protein